MNNYLLNNKMDLQQFIYDMNSSNLRTKIMNKCLSKYDVHKKYLWLGTIRLKEYDPKKQNDFKMNKLMLRMNNNDKNYLMTISYVYEGNKIHYISVIYLSEKARVIIFDPGFNLYDVGKNVLIPLVKRTFKMNPNKILFFNKTACKKSQYGIQLHKKYSNKVVPDAFCQSWTLFFLQCFVHHEQDIAFFESWCELRLNVRDLYLIQNFVIPIILQNIQLQRKYKEMIVELEKVLLKEVWKLKNCSYLVSP